jgi:hypothetical protein
VSAEFDQGVLQGVSAFNAPQRDPNADCIKGPRHTVREIFPLPEQSDSKRWSFIMDRAAPDHGFYAPR